VTETDVPSSGDAAIDPVGPGARLKAAREAAGLSLDQVAQQLKLAPRQVKAIEDETFAELPGRTFIRGFVRNYARLVNLDPDLVVRDLPDATPALGSPALHSTGSRMAELPSNSVSKRGNFARWLIPLVLIACVVGAAAYEWYRGNPGAFGDAPRAPFSATFSDARTPVTKETPLPNPLASEATPANAPSASLVTPNASSASSAPAGSAGKSVDEAHPSTVATSVDAPPPPTAAAATSEASIIVTYAGPSWTEIRDRNGIVVSKLAVANSVEPVRGTPPFDIVLGNAKAVTLTFRGKPIDLAPYTRQNVARLTLP